MTTRLALLALIGLALPAFPAAAAPLIENPASPPDGVKTIKLTEQWRAGGDDDEVFFGSVGRVLGGPDGTVLVLDTQLSQVQIYDNSGTFLQTICREGDGPGEVRGPGDLFYLPDGRICVTQGFPGKLIYLNGDGTPAGQAEYQPQGEPSTFSVMVTALSAPKGSLLSGIRYVQEGPVGKQTFFLSQCNVDGLEQVVFLEKDYAINFADFRLDEASMDFAWSGRMDIDSAGNVYTAPARDRYLVRVQDATGVVVQEFTRPIEVPERTDEERSVATKIHEAIGANYGVPLAGVTIEDTEPAINGLGVRPNGEIWVSTPANVAPEGTFAVFDVFDPEGKYTHQVALEVPGDPARDGIHFLADGRVVIVVGGLDAWLSQQGVEAATEDAPVLEVICYEVN